MHAPDITLGSSIDTVSRGDAAPGFRRRRAPRIPAAIARPLSRLSGFVQLAGVALAAVALATWSVSDANVNFANGSEPENWLGFWGASFADLAMQFFGLACAALLLPPLIWGLFRLTRRPLINLKKRLGLWAASIAFLATALGCIPKPAGWPLELGLGGVLGDAFLSIPKAFTGSYPQGVFGTFLLIVFAIPGLWLLAKTCNLHRGIPASIAPEEDDIPLVAREGQDEFEEPEQVEQGRDWGGLLAMPVGLLMHWGYSLSAFTRNRLAARRATKLRQISMMDAAAGIGFDQRAEPQFGSPADNPSPESAYDEADMADTEWEDMDWDDPARADESVYERSRVDYDEPDEPVPHTDAAQPASPAPRAAPRVVKKARSPGGKFVLPKLDLLSEQTASIEDPSLSNEALEENARLLEGVLEDFGVKGNIIKVRPGPVVTLYELEPAPGVKSSRVIGLAEDIARSMSAIAARVAVVPGRNAIGIELPNKSRETVYLREQLSTGEFKKTKAKLPMCLGKTIGGEPVIVDMAKMPHLLVAGTTGSGKSVAINTMILSLLYRLSPEQCKLIMIDPKMLELSIYDGIPHLLTPVVVDPKKAVVALKWSVREMEERYKKMSKVGVRNIDGFNTKVRESVAKGEVISRTVQTGFDKETGEAIYETEEMDLEPMPYIVVIIDEMADLMMVAGKDIEGTVQRLAQMARAAGIHVIMATQRPSTDVITGTIKANFPTRISFQVTSKIDSRVMLGESGAEQLLGMGDMLYMAGGGRITRVHGPFVDDQEVEDVVNHLKTQGVPQYLESITEEDEDDPVGDGAAGSGAVGGMGDSDDPYDQAVAIVLRDRKASTSYVQRRLSIGYNRAASLIERMEQEGLISPANHAGKREILVPAEDETI